MKPVLVLVLGVSFALCGCKEESVPEHVVQQKRKEKERQRRLKELKMEAKKLSVGRDAGVDHYRQWSPEIRQAFYNLFRARSQALPQKARALAQLGMPAVDALRAVASKKSQSPKKQALVSFMLVDLHMFRVGELSRMAREHQLPFLQRGAIEALARIGNGKTEAELDKLLTELPTMPMPKMPEAHGHGHGGHGGHGHGGHGPMDRHKEKVESPPKDIPPDKHPMVRWTKSLRRKTRGERWAYSEQQLNTLDRILHADSPKKLRIAITAVTDATVEAGLWAILRTPVSRPSVQAGVAFKIVEGLRKDRRRLRELCKPGEHQMLRMQAVRAVLESGNKRDRVFLAKLAQSSGDPMAPMLKRMLTQWEQLQRAPKPKPKGPKPMDKK